MKDSLRSVRTRAEHRDAIVSTLNDILKVVQEEIWNYIDIISKIEIGSEEVTKAKQIISEDITTRIDYLLYMMERILKEECSSGVYSFVNYYWMHITEKLKSLQMSSNDNRMPLIIIVKSAITQTSSFIRLIKEILGFDINSTHDLWIIEIPIRAENYPLEWPIILHEVMHILHDTKLQIVPKYYGSKAPEGTPEGRRYKHSLEYLCDFLSTQLIGAVYPLRIIDFYFMGEYRISVTHPPWTERLMLLKEHYSQLFQKIGYHVMNRVEQFLKEHYKPPEFTRPDRLEDILKDAATMLNIDNNASFDVNELQNAINKLRSFVPYTNDMTTLFNAAFIINHFKLFDNEVSKYFEGNEQKLFSEFFYLISDCTRLCYARQLLRRFLP
jgi:hypothetical protein